MGLSSRGFKLFCSVYNVFLRPGSSVRCIYGFPLPKTLVKTLAKNLVIKLGGLFGPFKGVNGKGYAQMLYNSR